MNRDEQIAHDVATVTEMKMATRTIVGRVMFGEVVMTVEKEANTAKCPECFRVFDMTNTTDAEEWAYGHDCE